MIEQDFVQEKRFVSKGWKSGRVERGHLPVAGSVGPALALLCCFLGATGVTGLLNSCHHTLLTMVTGSLQVFTWEVKKRWQREFGKQPSRFPSPGLG